MIPFRIIGGTYSGRLKQPDSPENFMDATLTFALMIDGEERQIPVKAKLVIGSNLLDREIEVYAPKLPDGKSIRADELQRAVRGYLFAFLNTQDAVNEFVREGTFS